MKHLVRKRTLNHLAKLSKWLSCALSTYLYGAFDCMHHTDKYWEHSSIIWPIWPNGWVFVYELSSSGFESSCSHLKTSDFAPALRKEFLDIQATIECGFTLKRVRGMTRTYCQMHRTDKYSEHSWIIWAVWPIVQCLFTTKWFWVRFQLQSLKKFIKVCKKTLSSNKDSTYSLLWLLITHRK